MKICQEKVEKYLEIAKSLKDSNQFFDMHTHPFEVIFAHCAYKPHPDQNGVYTTGISDFWPPRITALIDKEEQDQSVYSESYQRPAISQMRLSSLYSHTGPRVFNSHMEISGIDRILLLPVAPRKGDVDGQMLAMEKMFPDRERFHFGWSVSNDLKNDEILKSAEKTVNRFNISAIKIHPSQTEIDLSSDPGKVRVECILNVCRKLQLSLILHSGRFPMARIPQAQEYSTIDVLMDLNWDLSPYPVVFAHSASFSCSGLEMEEHILPKLLKLISRYDNLFIDISELDIPQLSLLIERIPIDRILFGSDALYGTQWHVVVKLLCALEKVSSNLESDFLTIINHNPDKHIFKTSKE